MKDFLTLAANCLGIVASVGGFILALLHLWKGAPRSAAARKKQVRLFAVGLIVFTGLLVFLSFRLKNNIDTLEQTGDFRNMGYGEQNVYYAIPYQNPPHLQIINPTYYSSTYGPRITEQRADGFKVAVNEDTSQYSWKATGIQKQ